MRQCERRAELRLGKRRRQLIELFGEHARRARPPLAGESQHIQPVCLGGESSGLSPGSSAASAMNFSASFSACSGIAAPAVARTQQELGGID